MGVGGELRREKIQAGEMAWERFGCVRRGDWTVTRKQNSNHVWLTLTQ